MSKLVKIFPLLMIVLILIIPVVTEATAPEPPLDELGTPVPLLLDSIMTTLPGSQRDIYSMLYPSKKTLADLINEDTEEGRTARSVVIQMSQMELVDNSNPNAAKINNHIERMKKLAQGLSESGKYIPIPTPIPDGHKP